MISTLLSPPLFHPKSALTWPSTWISHLDLLPPAFHALPPPQVSMGAFSLPVSMWAMPVGTRHCSSTSATHMHTCTDTHARAHTHAHTHTLMPTRAHARAHTRTHTRTHMPLPWHAPLLPCSRLASAKLAFSPYKVESLVQIMEQRLELAGCRDLFEQNTVVFAARKVCWRAARLYARKQGHAHACVKLGCQAGQLAGPCMGLGVAQAGIVKGKRIGEKCTTPHTMRQPAPRMTCVGQAHTHTHTHTHIHMHVHTHAHTCTCMHKNHDTHAAPLVRTPAPLRSPAPQATCAGRWSCCAARQSLQRLS